MPDPVRISVLVPVYNSGDDLVNLLACLEAQTLPREQFEVILVDNKSTEPVTLAHLEKAAAQGITVLQEVERQSSYAARNKAVLFSQAPVLAFTDADATPHPDWLELGLKALEDQQADLVGGRIWPLTEMPPTLPELLDTCIYLNQHDSIRDRDYAVTANLFVTRRVFDQVGVFDDSLISGGDVDFCHRAVRKGGFKLVYCAEALVDHPARDSWEAIRKKARRIGYGNGWRAALKGFRPFFLDPMIYVPLPFLCRRARRVGLPVPIWRLFMVIALHFYHIRPQYVTGSYRGWREAREFMRRESQSTE